MKRQLSRRDFLKGAGACVLGAATTGILGACAGQETNQELTVASGTTAAESSSVAETSSAAGTTAAAGAAETENAAADVLKNAGHSWERIPEPIGEDRITETITKDVIIIGCGPSGMYTAASAAENGLSVAVVAKSASFHAFGGTHFVFNSSYQKETGHTIDPQEGMEAFLEANGYKVNQKIVSAWVQRSGEAMDWLSGILGSYGLYPTLCHYNNLPNIGTYPGGHTFYGGPNTPVDISDNDPYTGDLGLGYVPQIDVATNLMEYLNGLGVEFYFEHTCERLIREENNTGRVSKAIVRTPDGSCISFEGEKGIVIAAGSYGSDEEMREVFCPGLKADETTQLNMFDFGTGDLLKQAMWVGASMQLCQDHAPMIFAGDAHPVWDVLLNAQGQRFTREDLGTSHLSCSILRQTGAKGYAIWDEKYKNELKPVKANIMSEEEITPEMLQNGWDKLVEAGVFVKADTLEEVLDALGLPVEEGKKSIEEYNAMCREGVDRQYFKSPDKLFALEGPFYGGALGLACLSIMGGLHCDERSRVLDASHQPVENLYAVGLSAGDFWANTYTTRFPGNSLGHCLTFGYLVGRQLAGLE